MRKVLCYKIPCHLKAAPLSIVRIRAPRLVLKRGLKLSETSSQGLSLSDAPLGRGAWEWHPAGLEPGPYQGLKALRSGNPETEEGDIVATSPSPFKTPEAGRLPWPHQLPSQAPSWEEGAACTPATGQGREGGWASVAIRSPWACQRQSH